MRAGGAGIRMAPLKRSIGGTFRFMSFASPDTFSMVSCQIRNRKLAIRGCPDSPFPRFTVSPVRLGAPFPRFSDSLSHLPWKVTKVAASPITQNEQVNLGNNVPHYNPQSQIENGRKVATSPIKFAIRNSQCSSCCLLLFLWKGDESGGVPLYTEATRWVKCERRQS